MIANATVAFATSYLNRFSLPTPYKSIGLRLTETEITKGAPLPSLYITRKPTLSFQTTGATSKGTTACPAIPTSPTSRLRLTVMTFAWKTPGAFPPPSCMLQMNVSSRTRRRKCWPLQWTPFISQNTAVRNGLFKLLLLVWVHKISIGC